MVTTKIIVIAAAAVALLIAGCLIEYWNDRRMHVSERINRWRTLVPVVLVILIALAVALSARHARGRDIDARHAASPLKPWFDTLRSAKGPCCSDADGYALSDVDWEVTASGYRVRIPRWRFEPTAQEPAPPQGTEMMWLDVDPDAVITEPNRAGRTMVWPIWGHQGPSIRCFMPGSMT